MRLVLVVLAAVTVACGTRHVESTEQVDTFLARGDFASACVALAMEDAALRKYAAERLAKYQGEPVAADCLCQRIYDADKGTFDATIAAALRQTRHLRAASCLAAGATDTRVTDRVALVAALGDIHAEPGWAALEGVASKATEPRLRAEAVAALQGSPAHGELILRLLVDDPDATVRAAAAKALGNRKDKGRREALLAAARGDAEAPVRLAAIGTLSSDDHVDVVDALCQALGTDPEPGVRALATRAFAGTKSARAARCLARRLGEVEEEGEVRQALLDAAKTSSRPEIRKALCDQIGPWLRRYVKSEIADRIEGHGIIEAQNHNHWEESYACVQRALAQPGYSCYARNHLGHWFNELGGKASTPHCPGMAHRGE